MAHFYGLVHGARGEASRLGDKKSGMTACAAGWGGAIKVRVWHDSEAGVDRFAVDMTPWHGSGDSECIATGIMGDAASLRFGSLLDAA